MAYRKELFEKYGGFRTDLSRCGSNTMSNEDTEFGRRLIAAGGRLRYEPSAVVYHPVPEDRLRKEFFLKGWFDYGRALVREEGRGLAVLGIPGPWWEILKLGTIVMAKGLGRWMMALNPQRRFFYKCRVWVTVGQIEENCRLAQAIP